MGTSIGFRQAQQRAHKVARGQHSHVPVFTVFQRHAQLAAKPVKALGGGVAFAVVIRRTTTWGRHSEFYSPAYIFRRYCPPDLKQRVGHLPRYAHAYRVNQLVSLVCQEADMPRP